MESRYVNIFKKAEEEEDISEDETVELLNIENLSDEYFELLRISNNLSKKYFKKGYVFVQIGINCNNCSGNCRFCSLAKDSRCFTHTYEKSTNEVIENIKSFDLDKVDAIFLMTTEDYSHKKLCEMAEIVRNFLPEHVKLVANCGDFDEQTAEKLKKSGFDCVYHIVRLREGTDTDIAPEIRVKTIDAAVNAGMELYYCIEPVGREHSNEEIAKEIMRSKKYGVNVMAVMSRVQVHGTAFEDIKEVDEVQLAKIVAVTRIVVNPTVSMNIHEPKKIPLLAGVNQLYAEIGSNPRDKDENTENHRGYSVEQVENMLNEAGYYL